VLADVRDEGIHGISRGAQLIDLNVQCLALDCQVVQDVAPSFVGLFHDRATLLATPLHHCVTVHLGRLDESFRGQARLFVYLCGGVFGLGQRCRGAFLGFDQVARRAMLALGKELRRAFLGLGGDAAGLFVRRAQNRRTLGAERAGQGSLIERRVRGAAQRLGQLFLQVADATLEVSDLARDGVEVRTHLLGIVPAFSHRVEVRPGDFRR